VHGLARLRLGRRECQQAQKSHSRNSLEHGVSPCEFFCCRNSRKARIVSPRRHFALSEPVQSIAAPYSVCPIFISKQVLRAVQVANVSPRPRLSCSGAFALVFRGRDRVL
jgi:hypothetical protein